MRKLPKTASRRPRSGPRKRPTRSATHLRRAAIAEKAKSWLRAHMAEGVSLDEVGRGIGGVSRWHLSRICRQYGDMPFSELVRTERIRTATCLLKDPVPTIKQIAAACSFQSADHFAQWFKTNLHCTPSGYRATYLRAKQ